MLQKLPNDIYTREHKMKEEKNMWKMYVNKTKVKTLVRKKKSCSTPTLKK